MIYCTRANIHVDRSASAWLIRRFIDPEAEFVFVTDGKVLPGTIGFDMPGVEWGHHQNCCSFETILAKHDLKDPVLDHLARSIHGADILTDADETSESSGVDLLFRGGRLISESDEQALERDFLLMDAFYAACLHQLSTVEESS